MIAHVSRYWLLAALVTCWLVWKTIYYGDLLPNTYYAKAADTAAWDAGFLYLATFVKSYPHVPALLALMGAAAAFAPRAVERSFALAGLMSLLLFAAYIAKVGGDFMHYRFAFEGYPLLVAGAGLGLSTVASRSGMAAVVVGGLVTLMARGEPVMESKFGMQDLGTMNKFYYDGTRTGPRLRDTTPPDTILSASLAGTVAYFSDRITIDELGLTDRTVARQPAEIRWRGHVKRASHEYLVRRGVNFQLTHPWDVPCTRKQRLKTAQVRPPKAPLVWLKVDKGDCVRMDYLVQTTQLTSWICSHPEWFVSDDLDCTKHRTSKAASAKQ